MSGRVTADGSDYPPGVWLLNATGDMVPLATEDGSGDRLLLRDAVRERDPDLVRQPADPAHPEVVCLCGSTRFKEQFREEEERLERAGKAVLSVGFFAHADDVDLSDEEKNRLDRLHKRKVEMAHRVHVVNPGGYVGGSTAEEIEHAEALGREVTYYDER